MVDLISPSYGPDETQIGSTADGGVGGLDIDGAKLILDADKDTYLSAATDDTLNVVVASATVATFVAGGYAPVAGIGAAGALGAFLNPTVYHSGGVGATSATMGTDSTPVTTETYIVEIYIPVNGNYTGVAILNGSAAAGNVRISMADSTGAPIAAALTASTAQSGTAAYQKIPFAAVWSAKGPGKYFILVQFNNTSARFRTHAVGNFGAAKKTGETFGTFTAVTPPTTFTADLGPVCDVY